MDSVARVVLLVFGHDGAASGTLGRDLEAAATSVRELLETEHGTVRVGLRLDDDPLAAIARERNLRMLDGAVEVTVPDVARLDALVEALDGFGASTSSIDVDASIAVAGTAHLVRGDVGPVMLASAGRRAAGVSRAAHSRWWLEVHGPMSMRLVPGSRGYQQLHGDPAASEAAAGRAGLRGPMMDFAETAYFDALEHFTGPMSDPAVGQELVEDEAAFIDHSSMVAAMCRHVAG